MNSKVLEKVKRTKTGNLIFWSALKSKTRVPQAEIINTMTELTEFGVVEPAYVGWCEHCDENVGSYTEEEMHEVYCCPFCCEEDSVIFHMDFPNWKKVREI